MTMMTDLELKAIWFDVEIYFVQTGLVQTMNSVISVWKLFVDFALFCKHDGHLYGNYILLLLALLREPMTAWHLQPTSLASIVRGYKWHIVEQMTCLGDADWKHQTITSSHSNANNSNVFFILELYSTPAPSIYTFIHFKSKKIMMDTVLWWMYLVEI